jgi:hypothetical protein
VVGEEVLGVVGPLAGLFSLNFLATKFLGIT